MWELAYWQLQQSDTYGNKYIMNILQRITLCGCTVQCTHKLSKFYENHSAPNVIGVCVSVKLTKTETHEHTRIYIYIYTHTYIWLPTTRANSWLRNTHSIDIGPSLLAYSWSTRKQWPTCRLSFLLNYDKCWLSSSNVFANMMHVIWWWTKYHHTSSIEWFCCTMVECRSEVTLTIFNVSERCADTKATHTTSKYWDIRFCLNHIAFEQTRWDLLI